MKGWIAATLFCLGISAAFAQGTGTVSQVPVQEPAADVVILRGLDKITGRLSTFRAEIGTPVTFGTLRITARKCESAPPEEPPETSAFLEIYDIERGEAASRVFSGWMFATSPALSAAEHPVYDVWVINCITSSPDGLSGKE